MAEHSHQPQAGDAVLGDRHTVPTHTAVLGGLPGVKRRLASPVVEQRIAALLDTLKYGEAGLDLAVQALQDPSERVQLTAYLLLRQQPSKVARQEFIPYRFFKCIRTLSGCYGPIHCIAVSPDGHLVSGGEDGIIKWHLPSRGLVDTLVGHASPVLSIVISPDGQILASGGEDGTIKLWHLPSGELIRTLILTYACSSNVIAISPDGKILYVSDFYGLIQLWNLDTGEKITTLEADSNQIAALAIGSQRLNNCNHGPIKLWDLPTVGLQCTLSKCQNSVAAVALSPNRQILATGNTDKIQLWHLQTGEKLHTLEGHVDRITAISISPDGQTLISASTDWTIKLWNLFTGEAIHTFSGPARSVTSLAIGPDGQTVASGVAVYPYTHAIKFWDLPTGKELSTLDSMGTAIALSPDGKILASVDASTIEIWNLESQRKYTINSELAGDTWSAVISPDGRILMVSGNWDRTIRLWDLHTGQERTPLRHAQIDGVGSIAVSPDGQFLASAGNKTVKLWHLHTGENLHTLSGHTARVCAIAISPDGQIASGSYDKTIKLWNLHTGKATITLEGHQAHVLSVAFSPDGKTLASGSSDKTVKLWNLSAGRELRTLEEHTAQVNTVAFSPDGQTLISGSEDKTIRVWGLRSY